MRKPLPARRSVALWLVSVAALGCGATQDPPLPGADSSGATRGIAVAAASDLRFAMEEIIAAFHDTHPGTNVRVSYGSSGNFYAQLLNRAPFDLYFSADVAYPRRLEQQGLIREGSLFVYAVGRLVVWCLRSSNLDLENRGIGVLEDLAIRHVAIANPQHAPYGQAAEAALRSLGLYEKVHDKLVFGENVSQTLQFVQSGAADAGFVALALALAPQVRERGDYWEVPLEAYPRLEQGGAILRSAADPEAAQEFRNFVLSDRGIEILRQYGFFLPGE